MKILISYMRYFFRTPRKSARVVNCLSDFISTTHSILRRLRIEGDWADKSIIHTYPSAQCYHLPATSWNGESFSRRWGVSVLVTGNLNIGCMRLVFWDILAFSRQLDVLNTVAFFLRVYLGDTQSICRYNYNNNNNNNNNNKLQLGCHPVAVVIVHVYRIWSWLLVNLSREGYMRGI